MHIECLSNVGKAETFQTTLRNPLAQYFSLLGSKIIVSDLNRYILHVSSLHQPHQTDVYAFGDIIICVAISFPPIATHQKQGQNEKKSTDEGTQDSDAVDIFNPDSTDCDISVDELVDLFVGHGVDAGFEGRCIS